MSFPFFCCRKDKLQEVGLNGLHGCKVAFGLNGWRSGLAVVAYFIDACPYVL